MEDIGITGIVPFTYFIGPQRPVGSTFLRVDRLVENSTGFEKWIHGKKYENLIFQKAYWPEMMRLFKGPKILDLCDPDWVKSDVDIMEVGQLVDAITCSSNEMTLLIKKYFPGKIVEHVPDRLDLAIYPPARGEHNGRARKVIWFGFIHNAHETLGQMLPVLKEYNLELTIISNAPYTQEDGILELKPQYIPYDVAQVYHQLKEADLVLNPQSRRAFFKYKSNNKSLISWKMGLPVAVTPEDVERLLHPAERNKEVILKQQLIEEQYDILSSVKQYQDIIRRVRNGSPR